MQEPGIYVRHLHMSTSIVRNYLSTSVHSTRLLSSLSTDERVAILDAVLESPSLVHAFDREEILSLRVFSKVVIDFGHMRRHFIAEKNYRGESTDRFDTVEVDVVNEGVIPAKILCFLKMRQTRADINQVANTFSLLCLC